MFGDLDREIAAPDHVLGGRDAIQNGATFGYTTDEMTGRRALAELRTLQKARAEREAEAAAQAAQPAPPRPFLAPGTKRTQSNAVSGTTPQPSLKLHSGCKQHV